MGIIERLRALEPRVADWLIAIGLAVLIELQFILGDQPGPEANAVNLIGGLLLTLPLAGRRIAPLAVISVFVATGVLNEAFDGGLFSFPAGGHNEIPPFASLAAGAVAFYSLGAHASDREAGIGLGFGLVGLWATVFVSGQVDLGSFTFSGGLALIPWLIGRNARGRALRLAAAEREQEQRTRLALSDERARIAREFHDVVAHSVGVMVVQAEGARRVLDRDPDRAREALDSIEDTGRKALADMRRSLGVLRADDDADPALEPQPGLDDLGRLLERAREGGLTVDVEVEGERRPLPQGVDLSAYRIVQEALTNTIKHAGPVRTRVTVRYGERELELEVSDDGPGPSANGGSDSGHGLAGMRERIASHGGELRTGPGPEGGFIVRASLPISR
jgi:signal transduction histidine kinase